MQLYWHQLQGSVLLLEMVMMTEVTSCLFPDPLIIMQIYTTPNLHQTHFEFKTKWSAKLKQTFSGKLQEPRSVASEHASYDPVLIQKWDSLP